MMLDNMPASGMDNMMNGIRNMLPLQQVVDLDRNDDMLEDGGAQPRGQVMSPRERGHQQVNAVQDRQFAFADAPADVVAENRRQEYREHHQGGNIILEQRNILQQVIHQFQQPPQMEMILENQGNVLHQLVQEAHRVRQEVKDVKTAMVHALQTVDTNYAAQQQVIHAQGQSLDECHVRIQRLNAKQDAVETAMGAVTEAQARLNEAMLSQEREGELRKAGLDVLEQFLTENVNDALLRLPEETRNLHQRLTVLETSGSQGQWGDRALESVIDNHQDWQNQVERRLSDLTEDQRSKETRINERFNEQFAQSHFVNDRLIEKLIGLERVVEEQRVQIVHLEANARMTKAELNTPDKSNYLQMQ